MSDKIKINLDAPATTIEGIPITRPHEGKEVPCTWAYLAYRAVADRYQGEPEPDFAASYDRGKLAKRLLKGGAIELTAKSLEEVKRLFAKRYNHDQLMGFAEALGIAEE